MNQNYKIKIWFLVLFLVIAVLIGVSNGSVKIPLFKLFFGVNKTIFLLRGIRVLFAVFVGAGLSVCGLTLQAILKNPLADPYLLGTSSGAGLATVLSLIFGVAVIYTPVIAFLGALLAVTLVYALAKKDNKVLPQNLILAGVVVAISLSAILVFLVSFFNSQMLGGVFLWLLGSLQQYDFSLIACVGLIVLFGILIIFVFSQDLNALSLGEEEALHLGVNVEKVKKILLIITSLITGAIVATSGVIGFVGLIIPHAMRKIVGPNHKTLILASCLAGAGFLVLADTLSRTVFSPVEIPIGVVTAVLGAPIFIFLLRRSKR